MQDWAICMPGTFPRLAPHSGALHAFRVEIKKGNLPEPKMIATSSVSFIPANVALQRSEEKHVALEQKLINLRKRYFVSLHPQLKRNAVLDATSMVGLLIAAHRAGKIKDPVKSYATLVALFPMAYKLSEKAVKDIFHTPSFLVYDNLFRLLMNTPEIFDLDEIFNSPIKIQAPAVNINKSGWTLDEILSDPPLYLNGWKNQGWVSVTNFKPEDTNLEKQLRNERYINGGINGMRVYGHFAPGKHAGSEGGIVDTAAQSNFPVHFLINEGHTNIVVLHYNSGAECPTDRVFKTFVEHLSRDFDICTSEMTRKAMLGYLRINNDLAQLRRQFENLKRLEDLLYGLDVHGRGKEVIRKFIREQEDSYQKLSYAHKKHINFYFVGSDRLIPDAHFSDFTQDQMIEGINIGWQAGIDAVPKINKMIA